VSGNHTHRITLISGDGVGPEVIGAARRVLEATGVEFEWDEQLAGKAALEREGTPLPASAIESIRERGVALKGPTSTTTAGEVRSANIALRRELDLYAGIRPCRAYAGIRTPFPAADITVVRMNHEDLYAGIEYEAGSASAGKVRALARESHGVRLGDDAGVSIKPISASEAARVAQAAFEHALANKRTKVTVVHKATVMRYTDGVFLDAAREVARDYPQIDVDDALVDSFCARLVRDPAGIEVALMPVLYGDIVSDLAAALAGGVGMAPGANVGDGCAVFEAVHGSAPRHAGANRVNPFGAILSGVMLLRHVQESEAADRLEQAVAAVIREGRVLTYDLEPERPASTSEVAEAVVAELSS